MKYKVVISAAETDPKVYKLEGISLKPSEAASQAIRSYESQGLASKMGDLQIEVKQA